MNRWQEKFSLLLALYRFPNAYTDQQLVCGKEGISRTLMTRTSAYHRG
jgi:hypothetical protein